MVFLVKMLIREEKRLTHLALSAHRHTRVFPGDGPCVGVQHQWLMCRSTRCAAWNIIKGQALMQLLLLLHQRHSFVKLDFLFSL